MGKRLRDEDLVLNVIVNGDPAKKELGELEESTREYKNANKDLLAEKKKLERAGLKESPRYKEVRAEIKKNNLAITQNEARMKNLRKEMGLSGMTMTQLRRESSRLNLLLNNSTYGTENWKKYRAELDKVEAQMKVVKGQSKAVGSSVGKMADNFNRYFGMISVWAASFTGVVLGFRKFINAANTFEEVADNTQALTKLSDENMQYFKEQSKQTSVSVVEDNIRIKNSATNIMDAYSIMGSKRPELLGVKEDLHGVTVEAMILSAAAKEELNPSVEALAISLNQFEYKAKEARRVINVLAAGSQAGAGNIKYLNQAVEKSGTTFALMNMEIEDNVAAIETIAPYYAQAEMAGNSLDKVMIKMRKEQIGYKNGVFDFGRALEELSIRYKNGQTAADLFGVEHAKMGELLVQNKDKFKYYKDAVTGSNVALEQAATNTDNNNAKLAQARNKLELMSISLGEKLAPALTFSTNGVTMMLKGVSALVEWYKEWKGVIVPTVAAVVAYGTAVKIATLWQNRNNTATIIGNAVQKTKLFLTEANYAATQLWAAAQMLLTGNIKGAAQAMRVFNATTKLNPIGALVAVIVAAGAALYMYSKSIKDANFAQIEMNKISLKARKSIAGQKVEMEQLLRVAKDEKRNKEDRIAAVKKLNELSPEYLGNLTLEKINTDEAKKATDQYIESLEKEAKLKAAKDRLVEIEKELLDLRQEGKGAEVKWYQHLWANVKAGGNAMLAVNNSAQIAMENYHNKENELLERKKALMGVLDKTSSPASETSPKIGTRKTVGNEIFEWDGSKWNKVNEIVPNIKEQKKFAKLQQQLQDELSRAGYENLKDGIEKEKKLENQRWIEEEAKIKEKLLVKKTLSDEEVAYNDTVYALIEEKKQAHLNRLDELEKADEERKKAEKALKDAEDAEIKVLEAETEEEEFQAKLELLQARYDRELSLAKDNRLKKLQAKKKYDQELDKLNTARDQKELQRFVQHKEITLAKLDIAHKALGVMRILVGEESALGKALFVAQQAIAVAQIIVNTAIANAKAVAASPLTFGQPWVTINTAAGAVGIASVLAQTITGLEEGGYTDVRRAQDGKMYRAQYRRKRGFVDKPSVLVGERPEFVANNAAVTNPTVKPVLDIIDAAQQNGEIHTLDLPNLIQTMPSMRGLESGGYTQPLTPPEESDTIERIEDDVYNEKLLGVILKLQEVLNDGIKAYVVYNDIKEKEKEIEKIKDLANL